MQSALALRPAMVAATSRSLCRSANAEALSMSVRSCCIPITPRTQSRTYCASKRYHSFPTSISRPSTIFTDQYTGRRYASNPSTPTNLKETPLYPMHVELKAKMGPFAGYAMPLEYPDQSHPESHRWTRSNASLFDVSHMVQHKISGDLAEEFLSTITPTSFKSLEKHSSILSCLLNKDGGIVDDTVITRIGKDSFYFVTNAGCRDTDLPYIKSEMEKFLDGKGATDEKIVWHILDHHALLALQGPSAKEVLQNLVFRDEDDDTTDFDLSTLYFGHSRWIQLHLPDDTNTPSLLVTRTGYTGEDGFEISIPSENGDSGPLAMSIAKAFIETPEVRWAGLAARDSLRLEAGMCLYGHDINEKTTPPMAGLSWLVGKDRQTDSPKIPFHGHEVINAQIKSPKTMSSRRVGFTVEKGPAAREGAEIVDLEKNEVVGHITSGCPAPSLDGQNIAMGMIKNGYHKKGTQVGVKVRNKIRKAEVAKMPFVENKFYRPDLKGKA